MNNEQRKSFHSAYISGDLKELETIMQRFPSSVIKFYNGSFSGEQNCYLDALKNQKLWLSSPYFFNDPFDCAVNVDYREVFYNVFSKKVRGFFTKDSAEEFLKNSDVKTAADLIYKMDGPKLRDNAKKFSDSIFVSCFSEPSNLKSLRMWGHYANSHKGFCLKYDLREIYKLWPGQVLPVLYSNTYLLSEPRIDERSLREFELTYAFTKAYEWKYENEWRLFVINRECAGEAGFLVPFVIPKSIFLGCKIEDKLKESLLTICKQMGIMAYQTYIKPNSYDLAWRKIEDNHS